MGSTPVVGSRNWHHVSHHQSENRYNHSHDMASIKEILKVLTGANKARDRRKATAPGETAEMVSQGMKSLHQLVQQQPSLYSNSDAMESAYATSDSKDEGRS